MKINYEFDILKKETEKGQFRHPELSESLQNIKTKKAIPLQCPAFSSPAEFSETERQTELP